MAGTPELYIPEHERVEYDMSEWDGGTFIRANDIQVTIPKDEEDIWNEPPPSTKS